VAVGSKQYTVTAAALVAAESSATASGPAGSVYLSNTGATVYLGGPNVSATTGAPLASGATATLFLFPGDELYAFCATSTVLSVLQT
jgi:hypothetical protein